MRLGNRELGMESTMRAFAQWAYEMARNACHGRFFWAAPTQHAGYVAGAGMAEIGKDTALAHAMWVTSRTPLDRA